jgi:hypothetical protein
VQARLTERLARAGQDAERVEQLQRQARRIFASL